MTAARLLLGQVETGQPAGFFLLPLGLPILLWDERWSTAAVERAMIAADVSRAKRAERIDSAAAAFILQGAIDALTR